MTPDQQIRLEALKLIVEHYKDTLMNGAPLTPNDLTGRATTLEKYIAEGKR